MGTALGIAGFTLVWLSTCLTEASLPQIAGTAAAGLALMAAGKLWAPLRGAIRAPSGEQFAHGREWDTGTGSPRRDQGADVPTASAGSRDTGVGSAPEPMRDALTAGARADHGGSALTPRRVVPTAGAPSTGEEAETLCG